MSRLTRGQRARLGVFLVVAAVILLGTVAALVGISIFTERDYYFVHFQQSVSGLEVGAPVKYNGVTVGRVESVGLNPKDVSEARVEVSLDEDTPVKKDTKAVLNLQGITGLKFIELIEGSQASPRLEEGGVIPAERSTLDMLSDSAGGIVRKVDDLLANLVVITGPENQRRLAVVLEQAEEATRTGNRLLKLNASAIDRAIGNVVAATDELPLLLAEARDTVEAVRYTVTGLVDPQQVARVLERLDDTIAAVQQRVGSKELGEAIASYTRLADRATMLVDHADLTLLRARDDLLRALDELVTGIESFSDFATMLRDDPSALIRGRRVEERELP
jgi:phospholipid/cholesterol/gamma-HCH transport system substrate-binding protein